MYIWFVSYNHSMTIPMWLFLETQRAHLRPQPVHNLGLATLGIVASGSSTKGPKKPKSGKYGISILGSVTTEDLVLRSW